MPKVLNKYKDGVPPGAVYIGRPSKWGNPFVIGKDGDREAVIAKYRAWLLAQPAMVETAKRELAGKDLVCFCSPKGCHGDVLIEVANGFELGTSVKVSNGQTPPTGAVRDGSLVECRCRRCRHRWDELEGTRHTEGLGSLHMCPRCFAEAIDRVRYYKVPND